MKYRPILFTGEMVRAILDGRKTQTRRGVDRLAKIGPVTEFKCSDTPGYSWCARDRRLVWNDLRHEDLMDRCPYGQPGDRLWVRESFGCSRQDDDINETERVVVYRAGGCRLTDAGVDMLKRCQSGSLMQPNHYVRAPARWIPSIHMPRWASRITLEVTAVRVERLGDISEADADAEGVAAWAESLGQGSVVHGLAVEFARRHGLNAGRDYGGWFAALWESIAGPGSWAANPWVWVIEFRRVAP